MTIKPEFETFSFEENCFLSYRWIFSYILPIFAMSNISLKKRSRIGIAFYSVFCVSHLFPL
nr:MAG TPA: hypothetical protein [Herelleviridae sp.]